MHSDLLLGSSSPMLLIGAALVVTYLLSVANWRARSRGLPFPPGPKPLPLLGNVFNFFPVFKGWYKIQQLSADYGQYVHTSYTVSTLSVITMYDRRCHTFPSLGTIFHCPHKSRRHLGIPRQEILKHLGSQAKPYGKTVRVCP